MIAASRDSLNDIARKRWIPHRTGFGAGILTRFDRWFASSAGVWQTFIVTVAIVILERIFPHVDPNGFWVLYALTVYSGVTQPALAHVGAESNKLLHAVLTELRSTDEDDLATDRDTNAIATRSETLLKAIAEKLEVAA